MGLLKRNPFGHLLFIKMAHPNLRVVTHRRYRGFNELQIEGSEILEIYQTLMYFLFPITKPILLMLCDVSMF
jgi:hypothetical protein